MSNEVTLLNAISSMADAFAKSRIYGTTSSADWMSLMFVAHSEGRHPASVARDYHIINGRPSLRSEVILARFQQAGGTVEWVEISDNKVTGIFSHPQGGTIEVTWDIARAQQAELKSPMWKKFPRQMLRARAVSEAVRAIYPVVLAGFYDESEVVEMPPLEVSRKVDVAKISPVVMFDDEEFKKWMCEFENLTSYEEALNKYADNQHRMSDEQKTIAIEAGRKKNKTEAVNAPND